MKKKTILKICIIFCIIMLFTINITFAGTINTNVKIGKNLQNEFEPIGNRIVGALQVIGIITSVAMIITVGIKYIWCSVEEKGEYKKMATMYLTGALLVFCASALIKFLYDMFSNI